LASSVSRVLPRVAAGVAGLLAAGAFALPASAADPSSDLAVSFTGTTLSANTNGKQSKVTITTNGPDKPTGLALTVDFSALDDSKVAFDSDGCTVASKVATCPIPDDAVPPAGGKLDLPIALVRQPGASGAAGSLTIAVSSALADPMVSNNVITLPVSVGDPGADLLTVAYDVYKVPGPEQTDPEPVPPGESSVLFGFVENQGDLTAKGVKIVVNLPEHVTFADEEPDCTYSADNRVATCLYEVDLTPKSFNIDFSTLAIFWPVTVAADAPGPVALTDGLVTADAAAVAPPEVPEVRALPKNLKWSSPDKVEGVDVDDTDNSDAFTVFVGAPAGHGAPGGLPETGSKTGLIAAVGGGVVILGVGLVLLTRRRRTAAAVTPSGDAS
jgi:LPXTG-motif cell wall-anchored protein